MAPLGKEQSLWRRQLANDMVILLKMAGLLHFSPWSLTIDRSWGAPGRLLKQTGAFRAVILSASIARD